jgi:23S rRNA pseudouridine2605 synthase
MPKRPQNPAPSPATAAAGGGERLQKVLAASGLASRRQIEDWIRAGRISVNSQAAVLGQRVSGRDEIRIDGRPFRLAPTRRKGAPDSTYLLHRSPGDDLVTGMVPRLPRRAGRRFVAVSPMPRIDGGLEIVTSDGALAALLQRRMHELPVCFAVRIRGRLDEMNQNALLGGVLDDGTVLQVLAVREGEGEELAANHWYELDVQGASGKQVRQLVERQGATVSRVVRTSIGAVQLTRDVGRGHFRVLTDEELAALLPPSAVPSEPDNENPVDEKPTPRSLSSEKSERPKRRAGPPQPGSRTPGRSRRGPPR